MGLFSRRKKTAFSHRSGLTETEMELIRQVHLPLADFVSLFGSICLSELMQDVQSTDLHGLIFSGKRMPLNEFYSWKEKLNKSGVDFQMSYNTISSRYRTINFEPYTSDLSIEDITKQLYKLRKLPDHDDFIEQVFYYFDDKSSIENAYSEWQRNFNAVPLWADGGDNLLICEITNEDLVESVFEHKLKIAPSIQELIDKGWSTPEDLKMEIRKELPAISLCFHS